MKKLLALLLVLVMSLCFIVSCGEDNNTPAGPEILEELEGKTSEEIFDDIVDISSAMTNYTMVVNTTINYGGGQTSKQVDTLKIDGQDQSATIVSSYGSQSQSMAYWWNDGMYYVQNFDGSKLKAELTYEKYLQIIGQSADAELFLNYPVNWFRDTVIKKNGSNYYLEGIIDANEFNEHVGSNMGATVSNIKFKVMITEKGEFVSLNMEYDQTTSGVKVHCVAVGTFTNVGTTVVDQPENPGSFSPAVFQ
jgi:hypothetical protein